MTTVRSVVKRLLRTPSDMLVASSTKLPEAMSEAVLSTTAVSAKFGPYLPDRDAFEIPLVDRTPEPIPPLKFWGGDYGEDPQRYLESGREHWSRMMEIVGRVDGPVLDFGCGNGRMLRCFNHDQEVWGTEQNQESVFWCQQYLSPPFRFFTATSFPHLPFADEYFSLVYACSVFTHIPDLADAWLLELRRVLNPQGRLYVTVNDEHALRRIRDDPEGFLEDHPDRYSRDYMEFVKPWADKADDFGMIVIPSPGKPRGFWSNVLYSGEFIHRYWGQVLKIHSLTPWAYGFQTAVLMTKHDPAREVAPP